MNRRDFLKFIGAAAAVPAAVVIPAAPAPAMTLGIDLGSGPSFTCVAMTYRRLVDGLWLTANEIMAREEEFCMDTPCRKFLGSAPKSLGSPSI